MSPSDVDVAVVITHHDQGRYLADAVASAVGQTHERLEVVVVDDGSTDPSSLEALDDVEAKDWGRPVRVVRQDNRYLGAARNVGIRSTDARYVAFCDDDDILEPDYVETLLTTARRSGAAAVATALRNRAVDDAGDFRDDVDDPVWVFLDGNLDVGIVWNTFGGAGMLVDRQVLLDAGGFHEHHGIGHEDWDLLLRLALAGHDVLAVPRPLYQYRILPTSMVRVTSQFANMVPLFASYAAGLPPTLQRWPVLVRGLHLHLDEARHELGDLRAENDRLLVELERRTRYIELLRTTSPERP